MIKEITGNLITSFENGDFDVIAHGCNCQCVMGSGIAASLREKWPIVYEIDCKTIKGDVKKLGNFTAVSIPLPNNKEGIIYNLYTQFTFGGDGNLYLSYPALELSLQKMIFLERTKKIGLPQIGCGLAGGNWDQVKEMIERFATKYKADVTIVNLEK